MGFQDVKVDGLSIENIKREINECNERFFGKVDYFDHEKTGQKEFYDDEKNKFLDKQTKVFESYFGKMKWDKNELTMRANEKIYVKVDLKHEKLEFFNGSQKYNFTIFVTSDFRNNPHYLPTPLLNSKGRYEPIGGTPIKAEDLKKQLDDIKEALEFNEKLNGNYNFRLALKEIELSAHYLFDYDDTKCVEYNNMTELLDYISDKYF